MDRTTTGVSSARSMSHDDPQILTEPPARIADLPDADVANAGGWANPNTLRLVYQQTDADTMLRVVLERGELREAK